ncbi:hypothetical protein BDV36DRAFT_108537 [Aspergillus pseudocaelatus]|uniref:Uncharacterized protein n=1 Tax=Aspergillus pseudocaelatus TaxID=1825620 RepID=A0ABQ6W155_9EURO|nr:hypothetical protein BDV36DRAFT_108537 [Aspergillus pseudocaelatus]
MVHMFHMVSWDLERLLDLGIIPARLSTRQRSNQHGQPPRTASAFPYMRFLALTDQDVWDLIQKTMSCCGLKTLKEQFQNENTWRLAVD